AGRATRPEERDALRERFLEHSRHIARMEEAAARLRRALVSIRHAERKLAEGARRATSAKRWGWFDLLFGGIVSGVIKFSRFDDAQACLAAARHHLMAANRLVAGQPDLHLFDAHAGELLRTFDYL